MLVGLLFPSKSTLDLLVYFFIIKFIFFVAVVKQVGQAGVFFGFGAIGALMLIVFFIMLPETKTKPKNNIE